MRLYLLALCSLLISLAATDIHLKSGDVLRGEIVKREQDSLVLDAMFGTARARVTIALADIEKISDGKLPEGYFSGHSNKVDDRVSDQTGRGAYLEVPVSGRFGQDIVSSGFRDICRYAIRHHIPNVVFVIDTPAGGHDIDEIARSYDMLKRYRGDLKFHALVRQCHGGGLAVLIACETVSFLPGAVVAGSDPKNIAEEDGVRVRQIAMNVANEARKNGYDAGIFRAMVDPDEVIALWENEDGSLGKGVSMPSVIPAERQLKVVKEGELLVFDDALLRKVGLPVVEGGVEELGAVLNIQGWASHGDYGLTKMAEAAAAYNEQQQKASAAKSREIRKVVERREAADRTLQHHIQKAAEYDPFKGDYTQYQRYSRWSGWSTGGNRLSTKEARTDWTDRSDAAVSHLRKAGKAIKDLQREEAKAAELGLEPLHPADQLEAWYNDLKKKPRRCTRTVSAEICNFLR